MGEKLNKILLTKNDYAFHYDLIIEPYEDNKAAKEYLKSILKGTSMEDTESLKLESLSSTRAEKYTSGWGIQKNGVKFRNVLIFEQDSPSYNPHYASLRCLFSNRPGELSFKNSHIEMECSIDLPSINDNIKNTTIARECGMDFVMTGMKNGEEV